MAVITFGSFPSGGLSEFTDPSANGGVGGVTISASDWVAGKYKARFTANAATSPIYYGDSTKVRIHLLGSAAIEAKLVSGAEIWRPLSIRWVGPVLPIYAGDEIHAKGSQALANGPAPVNAFEIRSGVRSWVIRGGSDPNVNSFVQWGFGQSPRGDENATNRFSQAWAGLTAVVTPGEWLHTMAGYLLHPSNGWFELWVAAHGQQMVNVVPRKTGIGTMYAPPITHYPMMSMYYDRSVAGDHILEYAAGAYADTFAEAKTWQAAQIGYDPWAGGSPPPNPNDAQPAGYLGGNYTATGSLLNGSQADKQRCSKILVPTTGTVNQLRVYIEPQQVVGTERVKLAVWRGTSADPSGAPVGTTAELAFTSSVPPGWYAANVATPFPVTAGETVWAGMINGGTPNIAYERYAPSAAAFRVMAAPYSGGPITWDTAADTAYDLDQLINLIGTPGGGTAPANTVVPTIVGLAQVGQALSVVDLGTWTGSPASYAYQWKRGGVAIAGATASSYVCTSADLGATIRCTVTASNATGSASADTPATAAVVDAPKRLLAGIETSGRTSAPRTVGPGRTAGQGGGGG